MSDKPLIDIWAWSQIEAAADDSLDGERLQRMVEAQAGDARLRAAIERARALRAALRASGQERPPPGLLRTLLAIPRLHARPRAVHAGYASTRAGWATAGGAFAAATLAAIVVANLYAPSIPPPLAGTAEVAPQIDDPPAAAPTAPEVAAVQDLAVALAYLNKSAAVTGREVGAALNVGFTAAFEVSRDSLSRRPE